MVVVVVIVVVVVKVSVVVVVVVAMTNKTRTREEVFKDDDFQTDNLIFMWQIPIVLRSIKYP